MSEAVVVVGPGREEYPARLSALGANAPPALWLRGDPELLRHPAWALFCSSRLPAELVLPAYDLARALRDAGTPVVSGFHSPVERNCLGFLLQGRQPVVVCPARGVEGMPLPPAWRHPLAERRLLLLGAVPGGHRRPTSRLAERRNRLVAALATGIFIVHAAPGGRLQRLAREVAGRGLPLACFDHPLNLELLLLGARPVNPGRAASFRAAFAPPRDPPLPAAE